MDLKIGYPPQDCPLYGEKLIYPMFQSDVNPVLGLINNLKMFLSEKLSL